MDKDRIEGKAKDIAGRVERQAGEWTGDKDAQVEGAGKQAEGKIQNTVGKVKDALKERLHRDDVEDENIGNKETDEDAA
jgi:uncharacterized protein YjbJ (UPF0337 family)